MQEVFQFIFKKQHNQCPLHTHQTLLYAVGFLYLKPISYLYSHSHLYNLIHHKTVNSLAIFHFN